MRILIAATAIAPTSTTRLNRHLKLYSRCSQQQPHRAFYIRQSVPFVERHYCDFHYRCCSSNRGILLANQPTASCPAPTLLLRELPKLPHIILLNMHLFTACIHPHSPWVSHVCCLSTFQFTVPITPSPPPHRDTN